MTMTRLHRLLLFGLSALLCVAFLAAVPQDAAVAAHMEAWSGQEQSLDSLPGLSLPPSDASRSSQDKGLGAGEEAGWAADAGRGAARGEPGGSLASDGWTTIMYEGFEYGFPGAHWDTFGDTTWDDQDYLSRDGLRSAWCAAGGAYARDPWSQDYANNMNAHMTYGPFDLSDASSARISFWVWMDTEEDYDWFRFGAAASLDVLWLTPAIDGRTSGSSGGQWEYQEIPLDSLCGEPYVWVDFGFDSDDSLTKKGVFIDDILLEKLVGPPTDTTPPDISNIVESDDPINRQGCGYPETVTISADVWDSAGSVAWVRLYYQRPGGSWTYVSMSADPAYPGTYEATIGPFPQAGNLSYYVEASDDSGNEAQSSQRTVTVDDCTCAVSLFDDFSDVSSGWLISDTPDYSVGYLGGEYQVLIKTSRAIVVPADLRCFDPSVEVDARYASANYGAYGLAMSSCDSLKDYYDVLIHESGQYQIGMTINGQRQLLVGWTPVAHINRGQSTNRVRLVRSGSQLSVYINGHFAETISDASLSGPFVPRLMGVAYDVPNVDIRFDDFSVCCAGPEDTAPSITNVSESQDPICVQGTGSPDRVTIRANISDDSGLDWVRLHYQPPGGSWVYVDMQHSSGNTYEAILGPFQQAGTLRYYIGARDDGCNEVSSDQRSITVEECCPPAPALYPIQNDDCDDQFSLAWTAVPGAIEYEVEYAADPSSPPTLLWPPVTQPSRTVTAPGDGTWYYRVRAETAHCLTEWSSWQPVTVRPVPGKPVLYAIDNADGDTHYVVSWSAVADAEYYELQQDSSPLFSGGQHFVEYSTSKPITGQSPGTWYYQVRACNCRDCGPWEGPQAVVVPPQPLVLLGNTNCAWGSRDCNRCANNVVAAFNSLSTSGDILGFHLAGQPDPQYPLLSLFHNHWQGVQRLMAGNGQYMVVSLDAAPRYAWDKWSVLETVAMASRNQTGGRYRSNRLRVQTDIEGTAPIASDRAVNTTWIVDWADHPGSIQAMGDFVFVGASHWIHLYDFGNPEAPVHIGPPASEQWYWDGVGAILERPEKSGSSSAVAQLWDGRYLLVVANSDAKDLDFYVSEHPYSLQQQGTYPNFVHRQEVLRSQVSRGPDWSTFKYDWDTFQNISLVTECGTGKLYLIATANLDMTADCSPMVLGLPCKPDGQDWASLYEVQLRSGHIVVEKVAEHWFVCGYRGETYCNFDAAAGAYVDPQGQLILYATEHASDGPLNTVKFMEFRPMPPGRCDTQQGAWVELYQHPGYTGRSIMIDFVDRALKNYANYKEVEDFNDQASSVRWCLPLGLSYVLWQDVSFSGNWLQLVGDGAIHGIDHLSKYGWDHPDGGRVSSSYFMTVPPTQAYIDWRTGGTLVYSTMGGSGLLTGDNAEGELGDGAALEGSSTIVEVPPNALSQSVDLIYTPQFPPPHETRPLLCAGYAFELQGQRDGVPVDDLSFSVPAQITIEYDGPTVSAMVDEATLMLGVWDDAAGMWRDALETCSPSAAQEHSLSQDWLKVTVCRIGEFALLGEPLNGLAYLPAVVKSYSSSLGPRPTPTAPVWESFRDDFDGPSLAPEWWWMNEDSADWSLSERPGFLRVLSGPGAPWQENLLLQGAPSGDFAMTTRVLFEPAANFQMAGVVLYQDDENYMVLGRAFCDLGPPSCIGNAIYFDNIQGGQAAGSNYASSTTSLGEAYLRVVRFGTTYFGYYSEDGENWSLLGSHIRDTTNLSGIGLGVGQDQSAARIPADFDFFEIRVASD
ncbi:MAG: hypothetical protein JSW37_03585 [Anaerolineales bacterium]|nr:MAG: hypothetical protein JSW37_03585 [Anaerolineales bacterium]